MAATASCSAPGKVLLAGGYLILDRPHAGAVIALDARFHTSVELVPLSAFASSSTSAIGGVNGGDGGDEDAAKGIILVEVHSPQFRDVRVYRYDPAGGGSLKLLPRADATTPKPNRYVEIPLLYSFVLLGSNADGAAGGDAAVTSSFFAKAVASARDAGLLPPAGSGSSAAVGLRITLVADNGFYSQASELRARGWPLSAASLRALPPMLPPRADESGELAKTGLGSSATLVTSLLGALLELFGAVKLPQRGGGGGGGGGGSGRAEESLQLLHSLSQLAHCAAQGKVGSGFDVCAAVFGSQRYVRFSPSLISELLKLGATEAPPPRALRECILSAGWDHEVRPLQLPPGVEVLMADVSCGANTPSMVKKVLAWRKESQHAAELWETYAGASRALQAAMDGLAGLHAKYMQDMAAADEDDEGEDEKDEGEDGGGRSGAAAAAWRMRLARCSAAAPAGWPQMGKLGQALAAVRSSSLEVRRLLRQVSAEADTAIEPPEQTALLDATLEVPGVLMAVVPGAGGNDAVIALILPTLSGGGKGGGRGKGGDASVAATRERVAQAAWERLGASSVSSLAGVLAVSGAIGVLGWAALKMRASTRR